MNKCYNGSIKFQSLSRWAEMMNILYIASASQARQKLISEMGISFKIIPHSAPEIIYAYFPLNRAFSFKIIARNITEKDCFVKQH